MDAREMNLLMNIVIYGLARGMTNLMADTKLVSRQAGFAMLDPKASELFTALGFPEIKENEPLESVVKKIINFINEKKIVGNAELLEISENSIKLEIKDCVFSQTARMLRADGLQPICPVVGLIIAAARKATGKELTIKTNTFEKTKNSEVFEIDVSEFE